MELHVWKHILGNTTLRKFNSKIQLCELWLCQGIRTMSLGFWARESSTIITLIPRPKRVKTSLRLPLNKHIWQAVFCGKFFILFNNGKCKCIFWEIFTNQRSHLLIDLGSNATMSLVSSHIATNLSQLLPGSLLIFKWRFTGTRKAKEL